MLGKEIRLFIEIVLGSLDNIGEIILFYESYEEFMCERMYRVYGIV